ncbi:hypothetical protein BG015_005332, partial [Linnemannia schmuckeri]
MDALQDGYDSRPCSIAVRQADVSDIIDENNRYLGISANSQMKIKMMRSVYYHSSLYEPEVIDEYAAEYHEEQLHLANNAEE